MDGNNRENNKVIDLEDDDGMDDNIAGDIDYDDIEDGDGKYTINACISEDEVSEKHSDMSGLSVSSDSDEDEPIIVGVRRQKVIIDDTDEHSPASPFCKKKDKKDDYNFNNSNMLSPPTGQKKTKVTMVTPAEKTGYKLRSTSSPLATSGKGTVL